MMKTIIYNILKIGYDGIAFAVCCGLIASFIIPIKSFLLFTVFVVFADTVTGIMAAKKRGEEITSKGLYRTSQKCLVYLCGIMIFEGARLTFQLPFNITHMVAFTIATTELFSIAETVPTRPRSGRRWARRRPHTRRRI